MDKKPTYAEFSSQLNDKNIVVLEFGRHLTRCGFAGELAPRAIIRTCLEDHDNRKRTYLNTLTDPAQLYSSLCLFIERIYFNHLAVTPKEKKVIIVESIFSKSLFRNTLTRVFFDHFNVPSILFVPDHLMALATVGRSTGLVVDLGAEEAISIAVVEGVTLVDGAQFASLGAKMLDSIIKDELHIANPSIEDDISPDILEDIRIKGCFVAPFHRGNQFKENKSKRSIQRQTKHFDSADQENREISIGNMETCYFIGEQDESSPASVEYPLAGERTLRIPGNLREGACEIFFEIIGHEHSLTTMIVETLLSAPIDCRKSLGENIFIIGGLANLPGLEHRLAIELKNIDIYKRYSKRAPEALKFHKPICPRNYITWLGASMFCTPCSVELRSTTRDHWIRDGRKNLLDWSDLIR